MTGRSGPVHITVNGTRTVMEVEARTTLADYLREHLGLTGTKLGCEHGVCGACTVLVDGRSMRSCLMLALQADGRAITTVEGLAADETELHQVQQAFAEHHALQCGFCTAGMLITVKEYVEEHGPSSDHEIRQRLSGNLCRCTGYDNIVAAVRDLVEPS